LSSVFDPVPLNWQRDLADELGKGIAAHPHDWHMMQPLFLDDLPVGDRRRTGSGGSGQ
jgi:lauroyl/myristoyl acyltransferase